MKTKDMTTEQIAKTAAAQIKVLMLHDCRGGLKRLLRQARRCAEDNEVSVLRRPCCPKCTTIDGCDPDCSCDP